MRMESESAVTNVILTEVTTYELEMHSLHAHTLVPPPPGDLLLLQAQRPLPELNRFLYTAIGGNWYWTDRLSWSYDQWMAWLGRPELETWVLYQAGTPTGYFELEAVAAPERTVNLAYFGLIPAFIGQGLGSYLLSQAIQRGWTMQQGTQKLRVNTCTLDHPKALANYQARGFHGVGQTTAMQKLPTALPGPWPNAKCRLND